jgi:septum formation protein
VTTELGTNFGTGEFGTGAASVPAVALPTGPLLLASASMTRRRLLEQAGFEIAICSASVDEQAIRGSCAEESIPPGEVAVILAEMKAQAALSRVPSHNPSHAGAGPGQLLLSADQILEIDGQMLGKPADHAAAAQQLMRLQGKTHHLHTAAVIMRDGMRIWHHLGVNEMVMRPLSAAEIEVYLVRIGEAAFWSPGSYQIESIGMHLFTRIGGCHYTILGLPLLEITAFLREHGLRLAPPDTASRDGA